MPFVEGFLNKLKLCLDISVLVILMSSLIQSIKPIENRQQAVWRIECELGMISDPECPVDGGWTSWEPWSACHGRCDGTGHRRRSRRCDNPAPAADGLPCAGQDQQTQVCYPTNCTVDDFRKLVAGDLVRTQAFERLETIPALMERCLQKECGYAALETALANENTWQIEPEDFWNSLLCVKCNLGCPVVGEWGSWGAWSSCGARCGRGKRWRERRCDSPPPSGARLVCAGSPLQTGACEGAQCAGSPTGAWSCWSAWSTCSESCGLGYKRRRRTCLAKPASPLGGEWATHCLGQSEETVICNNSVCSLDGGWSGWSTWGACSQTCGAGKRYRSRSCTRPTPSGNGKKCDGSKSEYGACYQSPCDAYSHIVSILTGESYLHFNLKRKRSSLFHFYIRFLPLSPHGTLLRRGTMHSAHVRLSLQNWHVCLDARGTQSMCAVPRLCSPLMVEPAEWHTTLITVTNVAVSLILDDNVPIKSYFPCDPELPNAKVNVLVGERLHGEVQEAIINFTPFIMENWNQQKLNRRDWSLSSSNVAFEKASIEEAYLLLDNNQYLRVPCFNGHDEWQLELTIKPKRDSGTILVLKDDESSSWLHLELQNMRLKLKLAANSIRSETTSMAECPPDQWLDILLVKKRGTNAIEALINAGERLNVFIDENALRVRRNLKSNIEQFLMHVGESRKEEIDPETKLTICNDEFFIGGAPYEVRQSIDDELTPFSGVISSLRINNNLQDLYGLSVERCKDDIVQLSPRTASVSGSYYETAWGSSNRLNLACLHSRKALSSQTAQWLYLDTSISSALKEKRVRTIDDGMILKLVATAGNDLRGFYTCRAHRNRRTINIVSYGVVGRIKSVLSEPDTTTTIAVISSALLVLVTLSWLTIEGFHDLRTGFGFFRDAHLSPDEEAEAVCRYIDEHRDSIGSESAVRLAKSRARRIAKRLSHDSKLSFAAQEPQGLMQVHNETIEQMALNLHGVNTSPNISEELPPLPGNVNAFYSTNNDAHTTLLTHDVYKNEPIYVSSPLNGTKFSSTSSLEVTSPRFVCKRLLLAKKHNSSRQSLWSKKRRKLFNCNFDALQGVEFNLPTISTESSSTGSVSPAKKILKMFEQLRSDY